MKKKLLLSIFALIFSISGQCETLGEKQARSFMSIYSEYCLQHVNSLEKLRKELKNHPKLPPEKAKHFLHGKEGDAWPIPDKHGTFVLILFKDDNFCAVFGRRLDTHKLQALFKDFLKDAPPSLVSEELPKEEKKNTPNGPTESISYLWGVKNAPLQMHFMLTTAEYGIELQAFASAAQIRNRK